MTGTAIPLPEIDAESRPYWEAARQGRLDLQQCRSCAAWQFYPRALCLRCRSADLVWRPASGAGRVYSFTVCHRAGPAFQDRIPFVVALIDLAEGVRLLSRVRADPATVRIGMAVRVGFERLSEDIHLPVFDPA